MGYLNAGSGMFLANKALNTGPCRIKVLCGTYDEPIVVKVLKTKRYLGPLAVFITNKGLTSYPQGTNVLCGTQHALILVKYRTTKDCSRPELLVKYKLQKGCFIYKAALLS